MPPSSGFFELMMEVVGISEKSVYFNISARHYIPEGYHRHLSRHSENLKAHKIKLCWRSRFLRQDLNPGPS
jgi:hypothetical protein